jgi:uncharacterized repeat protein (TIGR01451 family)
MAFGASGAAAAPWACDGTGYVSMYRGTVGENTLLSKVVAGPNGTYTVSPIHTQAGELINSIAFRVQDGYMYGWKNGPGGTGLVRIESDGAGGATFTELPPVEGMPPFGSFAGTFLENGQYFIWGTTANPVGYVIDVSGAVPKVVTEVTPTWDASGAGLPIGDFAVSPYDGNLYATLNGQVYQLILSGSTLSLGPIVGQGAPGSGGAQWFSPAGEKGTLLQISSNPDGLTHLYATNMATGVLTDLGPLDQTIPNGDGTACANTVAVTKDASPRTVTAGEQLTYTYTVVSHGQVDNSVDFADTLPAGMTYVPGGVTVNGTFGSPNAYGGTGKLTISGVIPRNTTVTITAKVQVAPTAACNANPPNQATATMHTPGLPDATVSSDDPTTLPTEDPTVVHVECRADVAIEKTSSGPVIAGKDATYDLKVTNNGPSQAAGVVASDPLPEGETFVSASNGCTAAAGKVTCDAGKLEVGESKTFEVTVKVAAGAECSALTNTATVATTTTDPDPGNNSSTVRNCEAKADLEIKKEASSAQVAPDGQAMYTLVVKNKGPSDDHNVTVDDSLPAGVAAESAQASQGSCSLAGGKVLCGLGYLAAEGAAQVLITAKDTAPSGCQVNTAEVTGNGYDPTQADNRSTAKVCVTPKKTPQFDLAVKKTVKPKRVFADGTVTYTLLVTNNGPETAPNARVTDTFNRLGEVLSVKTTAGTCTTALPLGCSLGDLAPGAKVTITVRMLPLETGKKQRNVASVTGEGNDTDPSNNQSGANITVVPRIKITKVADRRTLEAGGIVHYRIKVTNLSKRIALRNVRTCDHMPAGLAYIGAAPKAKLTGGMPCWTAKAIKGGGSVVYRVTAKVLSSAKGIERNVATAKTAGAKAVHAAAGVVVHRKPPRPTPVTG